MKSMVLSFAIVFGSIHFPVIADDHSAHHAHEPTTTKSMVATHNTTSEVRSGLAISHVVAKPTIPGVKVSSGYLRITNESKAPIRLVGAETPVASHTELHRMFMRENKMAMRKVDVIELAPNESLEFGPHGYHLMFISIKEPFKEGQSFPLALISEDGARYETIMKVAPTPSH
ncbi:copper chaperone PCu(A)C [Vibrio sp. RC27]